MLHVTHDTCIAMCDLQLELESLIRWKRREKAEKGGKGEFDFQLDFWQKRTSLVEMS